MVVLIKFKTSDDPCKEIPTPYQVILLIPENRIERDGVALQPMEKIKNILRQLLIAPFIGLIQLYRWVISPWLGPKCRYTPTCSQYAMDALRKHGMMKGLWKALHRISRCHPWGGSGYDPA